MKTENLYSFFATVKTESLCSSSATTGNLEAIPSLLFNSFWLYIFTLQIFMDQFGAASQQECYHSLFPFRSTKMSKIKEILPSSRSVRFVSATPYTQGQHNIVNFPVSNTLSVQFTKFGPLSFHLHVPFQTNRHRKKKIQNRKPILCLQKLKRTLLFYQHLLQSDPFCNYQFFPKKMHFCLIFH